MSPSCHSKTRASPPNAASSGSCALRRIRALTAASAAMPAAPAPKVFQNFPTLPIFNQDGGTIIEPQRTQGTQRVDKNLKFQIDLKLRIPALRFIPSTLCVLRVLCGETYLRQITPL